MLRIFDTTLVCIDCRNYNEAISALSNCLNQVEFDNTVFITDEKISIYPGNAIIIPKIKTISEYSRFVLKELHKYIKTKYILICQYDGFIINPLAWNNKFYEYDYIGAPWRHHRGQVGNGGFSFRSLRLHKILANDKFDKFHPEDDVICRRYGTILEKDYKIKFAPKEIAETFSLETNPKELSRKKPFGFHGKSCISEAKKIIGENQDYRIKKSGIKVYLRPIKNIPLL